MERKGLVQILFRVSRDVAKRFDGILKVNNLTRQDVLGSFMAEYTEDQATGFLMSRDKLGELQVELRYHEQGAEQIKEEIALFEERAAKLQKGAGAKKPKAPEARRGGKRGK
jgi:hypothetical protein